MQLKNCNFTIL